MGLLALRGIEFIECWLNKTRTFPAQNNSIFLKSPCYVIIIAVNTHSTVIKTCLFKTLISSLWTFYMQKYSKFINVIYATCFQTLLLNQPSPLSSSNLSNIRSVSYLNRRKQAWPSSHKPGYRWRFMMTSSTGNIFRVTGPLWGKSTGHQWIPHIKASDAELWCFLWCAPKQALEQTYAAPVI